MRQIVAGGRGQPHQPSGPGHGGLIDEAHADRACLAVDEVDICLRKQHLNPLDARCGDIAEEIALLDVTARKVTRRADQQFARSPGNQRQAG